MGPQGMQTWGPAHKIRQRTAIPLLCTGCVFDAMSWRAAGKDNTHTHTHTHTHTRTHTHTYMLTNPHADETAGKEGTSGSSQLVWGLLFLIFLVAVPALVVGALAFTRLPSDCTGFHSGPPMACLLYTSRLMLGSKVALTFVCVCVCECVCVQRPAAL